MAAAADLQGIADASLADQVCYGLVVEVQARI